MYKKKTELNVGEENSEVKLHFDEELHSRKYKIGKHQDKMVCFNSCF